MIAAPGLLLDTCVLMFAASGEALRGGSLRVVDEAGGDGRLFVSPVSAWEIGLLMSRGRLRSQFSAIEFFEQFVKRSSCLVCDLTPAILANASFLPNSVHRDPADCLMMTTARTLGLTLVTRDRAILAYGSEGYLSTLAC